MRPSASLRCFDRNRFVRMGNVSRFRRADVHALGTIAHGASRSSPQDLLHQSGMSQAMITNGFRFMASRPRPIPITDRAAARRLGVSARMVRLWVHTGAWPLPRSVVGGSWLFDVSDLERWLERGVWPAGVRFRVNPLRGVNLARSGRVHVARDPEGRAVSCLVVSSSAWIGPAMSPPSRSWGFAGLGGPAPRSWGWGSSMSLAFARSSRPGPWVGAPTWTLFIIGVTRVDWRSSIGRSASLWSNSPHVAARRAWFGDGTGRLGAERPGAGSPTAVRCRGSGPTPSTPDLPVTPWYRGR